MYTSTFDWTPGIRLATKTERFQIRSLTPQDANDTYLSWWNDAEVQAGLNMPARGWTRVQAVKHISKFDNRHSFHLGIFTENLKRELIGFFTIFHNPRTNTALTNVVIGDKNYWGEGVVLEVRGHLLYFIFEKLGAVKVKGEISGRNLPSIFNYQAQGFKSEGVLRSELPHYDKSSRIDKYLFGLQREDWIKTTTIQSTTLIE